MVKQRRTQASLSLQEVRVGASVNSGGHTSLLAGGMSGNVAEKRSIILHPAVTPDV